MKKILTSLILVVCMFCSAVFSACGKTVTIQSISITTLPKTEYVIEDALDLSGGELTATYSDNSTEKVKLTESSVTVQKPNMRTVGEKTVSVTYKSKSATFKITVSEAKLSVVFDLNYEGAASETVEVDKGAKVSAPATDPVRSGYKFLGWYVAADSESKFNFDVAVSADTIIYARWSASYAVTFDMNYAGSEAVVENVDEGTAVARPSIPERSGYLFTGWYTTADLTTEYDFAAPVNAPLTLYAGWQEVQAGATVYKVTFDFNYPDGSEGKAEKQAEEGKPVVAPADPTFEGSTFDGWYVDEEFTAAYNFSSLIEADTTIYAKWTVSSYVINYYYNHVNNASLYKSVLVASGRRPAEPPTPELSGFYFCGWYREKECLTTFNFNAQVNAFHSLYAKWLKVNVFEAEYTDLTGKAASGYSSNGFGPEVLIKSKSDNEVGASNGHWVSDLHYQGAFLEFKFNSDAEVTDAVLVLRISADFFDITLNKENFGIDVNGTRLDYSAVVSLTDAVSADANGLTTKRPFSDHVLVTNLRLQKGENVIKFTMLDDQRYGETGTMYATAPMFDCIYVNTNAGLTWAPHTENI